MCKSLKRLIEFMVIIGVSYTDISNMLVENDIRTIESLKLNGKSERKIYVIHIVYTSINDLKYFYNYLSNKDLKSDIRKNETYQ